MDVHLINTPALASTAIASIAPQPIIYLDCEGSDLGAIDGTLSLLSIGIPSPHPNPDPTSPLSPRIYLFDTLSLPLPSLSHLLALLASPNTLKLVWDGRQDFSELFHRFNTPLTNVVDLQLVDIHSRSVRKETDIDRLRRISLKCHPMWQVGLLETDGIHGLVGLKRAPREHMVYTADLDSEEEVFHDKWMARPLLPSQLHYAAKDIVLLARLHAHFLTCAYMSPESDLPFLKRQSARYVSLHRRTRPDKQKNVFVSSAFCPLEILDGDEVELFHVMARENNAGLMPGRICGKCTRELALARSFPKKGEELDEGFRGVCKLCMFLMIRQPLLEQSRKKPGEK